MSYVYLFDVAETPTWIHSVDSIYCVCFKLVEIVYLQMFYFWRYSLDECYVCHVSVYDCNAGVVKCFDTNGKYE